MPFVTVQWVEGHSQERRDEVARRVTAAIHEVTALPPEVIWVVFEDVSASAWYTGATTVASQRAAAAKKSK